MAPKGLWVAYHQNGSSYCRYVRRSHRQLRKKRTHQKHRQRRQEPPQQYSRTILHFHQQGKMVNCLMCDHPDSKGFRWMAGCDIPTVCLSKRPGSRRAEDEEQCYAKYDKTVFHEHLADRATCIYQKLALELEVWSIGGLLTRGLWGESNLVLQTKKYTLCLHVQVHLQRN